MPKTYEEKVEDAKAGEWGGLEESFDADEANLKEHEGGAGNAIVNELVKSYGFSRSAEGEWDWNLETIGKSFKDDPFWTTLDWLAISVAPLKWGTSIRAVKKGIGAAGKGLKAGDFAAGGAVEATKGGRGPIAAIFESFHGAETMAAAKLYKEGPSRWSRLANPITTKMDDDYLSLIDKHGTEVYERRAVAKALKRDEIREAAFIKRTAEDTIRTWSRSGASQAQLARGLRFLKEGKEPTHELVQGVFKSNEKSMKAYESTWDFRNTIHDKAYDAGLISKETYAKNLETYSPAMYKEWQKVLEATEALAKEAPVRAPSRVTGAVSGIARFLGKGKEPKALTNILDPKLATAELAKAGAIIAKQNYAQNIAKSVIARDADEVADAVMYYLDGGNSKMAMLHGVTKGQLAAMKVWKKSMDQKGINRQVGSEEIAAALGWTTLDSLFAGAKKVPGYIENLPPELRGKLIDPAVTADIINSLKYFDDPTWIKDIYDGGMTMFRVGKTAYSPPTIFRNIFGASVTHNLAIGGIPFKAPKAGLKAYIDLNDDYREARSAGLIGSSFDAEMRGRLDKMSKRGLGQKTALDFLGDSEVAELAQAAGGVAERFYRGVDEVFKLDAFIVLKNRGIQSGLSKQVAAEKALEQVNKMIPQFMQHSDLANTFRTWVPFSSFTTEAARVYKNSLIESPHRVYMWNHIAETMTDTFGAMAGFSPEQLDEAEQALPGYVQGKKTMALPFNVDGKPRFVDLSYLIPMANTVESEKVGHSFFSNLPIDPSSNPFLSLAAAATTGVDTFSGRDIAPNFTERQLGIPVTNQRARQIVGLAEHSLRTFLPPTVPPGYTGVNLLEYARGQKHPKTGEKLEEGAWRTVMANLVGIRTYAADIESQVLNLKREQRDVSTRMTQSWRRWESARANGKVEAMAKEKVRILGLREEGGHEDAEKYFAKSIKRRQVFASLSTKQLKAALERADKVGAFSPRDERLRAELIARLQMRSNK